MRKSMLLMSGVAVISVAVGFATSSIRAEANLLDNLLNRFRGEEIESPIVPITDVTPYHAPLEYEEAIITAIESAAPAVISIIITKDLPVIERCPFNPFGDLPPEFREFFGPFLGRDNLNVGCAWRHCEGFVNLDCDPRAQPDVVHDLESTPLPFADESFDCIFASHVLEHVQHLVPLMEDFHRILRPGGFLIAVTPYGHSDDAWDSPHHVRAFTENTWTYFDQRLYSIQEGHAGYGAMQNYRADFRIVEIAVVPFDEFLNDPELEFKKKHWRNVIRELRAIVRKV